MNALRILFRTSRFNLSKVGPHFINPVRQVLMGKGKITSDDQMVRTVEEILTKEPAVGEVRRE